LRLGENLGTLWQQRTSSKKAAGFNFETMAIQTSSFCACHDSEKHSVCQAGLEVDSKVNYGSLILDDLFAV
jgi:hypothetical protein